MREAIISDPIDVRNEVEILGLDVQGLIDCVRYAEHERSFVTKNDSAGFAYTIVYDKAGRALRERYLGEHWVRDDSNNQCAIKNPSLGIRVVPCNFDEFAGNRLKRPTNKSPKGEISRKKSGCNATAWLPGFPEIDFSSPGDDNFQTWILGIYTDDEKPTAAELSYPIEFSGKYFTRFGKRIVLISGEDEYGKSKGRGDTDPESDAVEIVDIDIRRK